MTQQTISIGNVGNDRQGDDLRTAGSKINSNFTELYTYSIPIADTFTATAGQSVFTLTQNPGSLSALSVSVDGAVLVPNQDYAWFAPYTLILVVGLKVGQVLLARYGVTQGATTLNAAGTNGQVLYNNNGVLSGSTITYNVSTRQVAIAAPTSGAALTVVSASGYQSMILSGAGANRIAMIAPSGSAFVGYDGVTDQIQISTKTALVIQVGASYTTAMTIAATGAVTIAAPTSGTALTVNGVAPYYTAIFSGGNAGLQVTNTDIGVILNNAAAAQYAQHWYQSAQYKIEAIGANSMAFGVNGAVRLAIATTGAVTINAPTSGTALTVTGAATGPTAVFTGPIIRLANGQPATVAYQLGPVSAAGDYAYLQWNNTVGSQELRLYSDAGFQSFYAAGSERMRIAAAGNVTINAPTSGTALTVAGNGVSPGLGVTGAAGQAAIFTVVGNGGAFNTGLALYQDATQGGYINQVANQPLFLHTNNTLRMTVAAAGNVTIAAPTSGTALSVTGVAGALAASFTLPVKFVATTVASLLAAATAGAGARSCVTDANATFTAGIGAVVVGGGANTVPVFCDGTNWRIG